MDPIGFAAISSAWLAPWGEVLAADVDFVDALLDQQSDVFVGHDVLDVVLQCCPVGEGASAVIVASDDAITRLGLNRDRAVTVADSGVGVRIFAPSDLLCVMWPLAGYQDPARWTDLNPAGQST